MAGGEGGGEEAGIPPCEIGDLAPPSQKILYNWMVKNVIKNI